MIRNDHDDGSDDHDDEWLHMSMHDYTWVHMCVDNYWDYVVWLCFSMYDYNWSWVITHHSTWWCMNDDSYTWLCRTIHINDYAWLRMTINDYAYWHELYMSRYGRARPERCMHVQTPTDVWNSSLWKIYLLVLASLFFRAVAPILGMTKKPGPSFMTSAKNEQ